MRALSFSFGSVSVDRAQHPPTGWLAAGYGLRFGGEVRWSGRVWRATNLVGMAVWGEGGQSEE